MSDIQEQIISSEGYKQIQQQSITPEDPNNAKKIETEEPKYFYQLLLAQFLVIIISTYLPTQKYFIYTYTNYPRSHITFESYCQTYGKCRESYYYYNSYYFQQDQNQYEIFKNSVSEEIKVYTKLFYFSLFMFPSFLVLQSIFRNCKLFKQKQRVLYFLQFPLGSLFIQVCMHLVRQTQMKQSILQLRILLSFQLGNILLLYLNQKFFKKQLEIKSTIQKCVNYSFIIICLKGIQDFITLNQSNWIPYILFILYSQVHLLHLNQNLFNQNNKYIIINKSVLCLIKQKLKSLFDVQDVYKEVAETHFVISNKMMYTGIIGSIVAMILRDYIFNIISFSVLSGIFSILVWDTSLVSTKSKVTLKDQYQAANLFFLDFLMPIRNIFMALLI
ncbi:unnamed protein product [Paramecium sonneborni]|uniref:Transmembrane protein n=1 Tax=Paramecium sonneborni TaxID=65129 RepID=A0A8S1PAY2_9CILI|nr:unnamed protein product [Paramecium sonneborni]